jgi:hypothetical protein
VKSPHFNGDLVESEIGKGATFSPIPAAGTRDAVAAWRIRARGGVPSPDYRS